MSDLFLHWVRGMSDSTRGWLFLLMIMLIVVSDLALAAYATTAILKEWRLFSQWRTDRKRGL